MKDIALVYMVAGISSRFGGKLKQFAQVGPDNETLIEYSLKQAIPAGFNKIIFIVGNKTESPFKEKFGNNYYGIPIEYALQNYDEKDRDKPWGTADALCSARQLIDSPFVVCNGDDLYGSSAFRTLVEHIQNSNDCAAVGYKLMDVLPEQGSTNRGIFRFENGYVKTLSEVFNIVKSDLNASGTKREDLCSMNIFALYPKTLDYLQERLELFKKEHVGNRKAECLLPTELSNLIETDKIRMKIYEAKERWKGITNPEDTDIVREKIRNLDN